MSEDVTNKKFDVTITVTLPGYQKSTVAHVSVEAPCMEDGLLAAKAIWYKATETKDIAIKETS